MTRLNLADLEILVRLRGLLVQWLLVIHFVHLVRDFQETRTDRGFLSVLGDLVLQADPKHQGTLPDHWVLELPAVPLFLVVHLYRVFPMPQETH